MTITLPSSAAPRLHRACPAAAVAAIRIGLAALCLLAVVLLNGRPAAFPDTAFYYSQGRQLAQRAGLARPADALAARSDPTAPGSPGAAEVSGARAPGYGLALYAAHRLGSLWLLAAAQAAIAAWLLWVLARVVLIRRVGRAYCLLVPGLAAGSSLPFFAGFAMPDLFAALGALAMVLLVLGGGRLRRAEQLALAALVAISAALHSSHLLVFAGLAATMALGALVPWLRNLMASRLPLALAALAAGALLTLAGSQLAAAAQGGPQGQPPFLTARALADGPGRAYLRSACARAPSAYTLCRFADRPLDRTEDILWSKDPTTGVFGLSDPATRRALEQEQPRFVLAVIAADPAGALAAALRNWAVQLATFRVEEPLRNPADFLGHPEMAASSLPLLIPDMGPCRRAPDSCRARLPFDLLALLHEVVLILSVAFVGWRLSKPDVRHTLSRPKDDEDPGDLRRLLALTGLLIAAVLINAAVCGMLSGSFPRYGARMVWLVPLAALLLGARLGLRSAGGALAPRR